MTADVILAVAFVFVLGAAVALASGWMAFKVAARYQRTGHAEPTKTSGATAQSGIPVNPEVSAHRRIIEDARETGADQLQAMAREAGEHLSREEAIAQADRMLRGEGPLGGVQ